MVLREQPAMFDEIHSRIIKQADYLLSFIDKLLKLSKAGKILDEKKDINFEDLVKKSYLLVKTDEIPIDFKLRTDIPVIVGDPTRLEQVFMNLLQNAITFRDANKNNLIIDVECKKNCSNAIIKVSDNGRGIKKANFDKIFNVHYTEGQHEGFGFGLTISKKIIEAHGGQIWVENSEENSGSTICFTLPLN